MLQPDGLVIDYVVDAMGRRIARKRNGALQAGWVYDGQLRVVAEVDSSGGIASRFVYGSFGHVPDLMLRNGVLYRYVADALGSVRLVLNVATGEVAQRLDYDPWGEVALDTRPGFQPFGFGGGLYDVETGLVRFGARCYDPQTGTFLSVEPMLLSPAFVWDQAIAGVLVSPYAYAVNNPIRFGDPSGLCVSTYDCCLENNPGVPEKCGAFVGPRPDRLPEFDWHALLTPVRNFVEDVCTVVEMAKGGRQNKIPTWYLELVRTRKNPGEDEWS